MGYSFQQVYAPHKLRPSWHIVDFTVEMRVAIRDKKQKDRVYVDYGSRDIPEAEAIELWNTCLNS